MGMGAFLVAHILTFFQLNGQFLWKLFAKNEWAVAAAGVILSFFYMWGTKYVELIFFYIYDQTSKNVRFRNSH